MQSLAQSVHQYIRKHALLKAGDRVGAAVSGGADSVALLCLLLELRSEMGIVLSVVHFNHKLRGAESEEDERFVGELAQRHKLEFYCASGPVAAYASEKHLSLEAAARELRYAFFRRLLLEHRMDRIATAHTLDDQAETVLLRLIRGAGSRGLAGIYPRLSVPGSQFSVVRPLLGTPRKDLMTYLGSVGQAWREDQSNRDLRHARNRVRHGILPRLERNLNPAVREVLAETAEIARAEEDYWSQEVTRTLPEVWWRRKALPLANLSSFPLALQRRIVRAAAESLGLRLEFRQVEETLALSSDDPASPRSAALAEGWRVTRVRGELRFEQEIARAEASDFECLLPLPGAVDVAALRCRFEAVLVSEKCSADYNPEQLLDPALLGDKLTVRNWRAGDRFWPAHTKAPKKVKEFLQERHLAGAEKRFWPVAVNAGALVWMRGFPVPARLQAKSGHGLIIREVPLGR